MRRQAILQLFREAVAASCPVIRQGGDERGHGVVGMSGHGALRADGHHDVRPDAADALHQFAHHRVEVHAVKPGIRMIENLAAG